jgi:phosphotransferase system enzyme I (PtsI)
VQRLTGIAVSSGIAMGRAALLLQHPLILRHSVSENQVSRELDRLDLALQQTRRQLEAISARVTRTVGPELARIFDAQLLMLEDRLLVPRARDLVDHDRVNAEWALQQACDDVCALFSDMGDDYLRERRGDVADVVGRLRRNLQAGGTSPRDLLGDLPDGAVLVADDLPPSVAGQLDNRRVVGLVIETGSRTHHSAILARSLGIPAVAGVARVTAIVRPGDMILVDGNTGTLLLNPDAEAFEAMARHRAQAPCAPVADAGPLPVALTRDGVVIRIEANIERPAEAEAAVHAGAQGIGLFRSEYLVAGRPVEEVDEESQYRIYRDLLEAMAPLPVTIRTFDLEEGQALGREPDHREGGSPPSSGPLGMRALRLSLSHRDVFLTQIRALVRAARHGSLRVLFPFVTTVEELQEARELLRGVMAEVTAQDGLGPAIPVGAMIEVPSAALTADLLADDVDFFSIGTNDLVQYCLAADRADGRMAALYEPLHPAILRVIRLVVAAARARGRPVSVCGEMATDAASLVLLLGLGVTELSMATGAIPAARQLISRVELTDLRRAAGTALRQRTGREVVALAADLLRRLDAEETGGRPSEGGATGE